MTNILFIYEAKVPTVGILENMFLRLEKKYKLCCKFVCLVDIAREDITDSDVVVFIRMHDIASWWLARHIRQSGRLVVAFWDDIPFTVDKNILSIPWRDRGMFGLLNNTDVICSFNQRVLDECKDYTAGKRVAKIDTIIRQADYAVKKLQKNEKVKIVYAANADHDRYFSTLIRPVMEKIVEKYGQKISFTFVCVHPNLSEFEGKTEIIYKEGMPLAEYRKYMEQENFDIGLAPLISDNFSKYKNFNKYIEYTLSGILGIYSKVVPYTDIVEDSVNGLLANSDEWYDKLSQAINDDCLRKTCVINAQEQLLSRYSEEGIINNLKKSIPELETGIEEKGNICSLIPVKIIYKFFRPMDYIYQTVYYLFHGGVGKVIEMAQQHYRKQKAYGR